jgi:AraC-like DNA-binding protein
MNYREFQPHPLLSGYVECFWLLEGAATQPPAAPERLLPDGCIELILNFGERFREYDAAGHCLLQPERFVVGQMTRPVLIAPTGAVQILGIRFAPIGALPFLPVLPGELTDRMTPLDAVSQGLERELIEQLEPIRPWEEKIALVEGLLLRRLHSPPQRGVSLQPALAQFVRSGGCLSVDRLAADLGVSQRQLERRFIREVGLGPKLLGRILRFQQVFRAVESANVDWAGVAVKCGYYDQAHLIRDFRQFAGQTPTVLFDDFSRFTEIFTRKHRRSDFSNTPQPRPV